MKSIKAGDLVEVWEKCGAHGLETHLVFCTSTKVENNKFFIGIHYFEGKLIAFEKSKINKIIETGDAYAARLLEFKKKTKKENQNGY